MIQKQITFNLSSDVLLLKNGAWGPGDLLFRGLAVFGLYVSFLQVPVATVGEHDLTLLMICGNIEVVRGFLVSVAQSRWTADQTGKNLWCWWVAL